MDCFLKAKTTCYYRELFFQIPPHSCLYQRAKNLNTKANQKVQRWLLYLAAKVATFSGIQLFQLLSQREYMNCEPSISRNKFIVLVEGKWKPFLSCIRLCQAPCLVLKTRRVKVKRDSSARFKRCLPTSVSSPNWIPLSRKIQKHVHDNVACSAWLSRRIRERVGSNWTKK